MKAHSATLRQIVHISMGAFALLLRDLAWWQAALLAAIALVFNLLALPRVAGRLFRPGEINAGRVGGIVLYPVAVLVLVIVFRRRPDIVAAAWGILAFGDGLAGLVGQRVGRTAWPWNPRKTIAGTAAFVAGGSVAGVFLALWTWPAASPIPPIAFALAAPVLAAVVAALVESSPAAIDDNLSVPFTAAATLWACSLVSPEAIAAAGPVLIRRLPAALIVNGLVAYFGHRARTVSGSGVIAGLAIGVAVYVGAGLGGWALLFAGFASAAVASRVGLERKAVLGIDEERDGRRGAANAVANCGLGAAAALVALCSPWQELALLACVAALVAGSSDTVASELGKAWGERVFLPTTLARVRPGTPGAMSMEGTMAGVVAASALAGLAALVGLIAPWAVWIVVVAATAGALAESLLAIRFERSGFLDNDVLNVANTAVAAAVAVWIVRSVS